METIINNQLPLDLDEGKRKRESDLLQKSKTKKPNEEGEVNVRKKPGRKRLEVTESNTKKEKNRVAQRAWRERKEKYVLELEAKIAELENAKNKSENEKQQLKLIIEKLRSENTYLKNATSFIFTPTKETQMFMEQNKLKIQQKNLKQNNQGLLSASVPSLNSVPSQNSLNQELINNNIIYNNSSSNEAIPQLTTEGLDEALLNETNPELLNELYKLINMQNQENALASNQDPTFNTTLLTPDSLLNSTSSPLNPAMVTSISNSSSSNKNLCNMISPIQKDNIIVPSEYELNSTIHHSTADPNLLLMMDNQDPNKNLAMLNQPSLNTIDPALIGSSTSAGLPNAVSAALPNTTIDQNSLLTMSIFNNMPSTFSNIQPQPALASPAIDNGMYQLNPINQLTPQTTTISKPIINGSMEYRQGTTVKDESQPITDEFFANMIQKIHQQQTNEGIDEDDIFIQRINKSATEMYTNPLTGMPSPSGAVTYGKEHPSIPDELARMGVPYTPEDLDSESNKSGEVTYIIPRGIPEGEEGSDNSFCASTNEIASEVANREVKVEDKRSNSSHSTLQFPADQKPTKLNIPYSVFPRVSQDTVDSFINDAKLNEEELECLCEELKSKATCKEKLNIISKKVEVEGWNMEKWNEGRQKLLDGLCEEEKKKEAEVEKKCCCGGNQIKVEDQ